MRSCACSASAVRLAWVVSRALVVDAGHLGQLVDGQLSEVVAGAYRVACKLCGEVGVHAIEIQQIAIKGLAAI